MTEQEFYEKVNLPYKPDSANWALYCAFREILVVEGGDDDFAEYGANEVALEFSNHVTFKHIEDYDNTLDDVDNEDKVFLEIYLSIKPEVLKAYGK